MLDGDVPEAEGQDGAGDGEERRGPVFQRAQGEGQVDEGAVDEKEQGQAADGQADEIEDHGGVAFERRLDDDGGGRPAQRAAQDQQGVGELVERRSRCRRRRRPGPAAPPAPGR